MMERYNRQNLTYGENATKNLFNSSVLLVGKNNILVNEIAKNLLLSGVNKLFLNDNYDNNKYFNLSELNPMCKIAVTSNINIVIKENNPFVIVCGGSKNDAEEINIYCRENNCKMIWCCSSGVSGFVFVDALDNHEVKDLDGEVTDPLQIENIGLSGDIEVIGDLSNVKDNDIVKFISLVGNNIDFLRNNKYKIIVKNRNTVSLRNIDSSSIDTILFEKLDLQNGTIIIEKSSCSIHHSPLKHQLIRMNSAGGGPFLKNSLNEYFDISILRLLLSHKIEFEDIWSDDMNLKVESFSDKNVGRIYRSLGIEISCMSSIIGSYASNEVIKLITGKFQPLDQWFVYSDHTLVPKFKPIMNTLNPIKPELTFEYLMGSDYINNIRNSSLLMVGCGAIGCEMLKNLAQFNFCTEGDSKLIITDPDHIETSNLSRQFLFRHEHVKQSKSKVASEQIKKLNSSINIEALDQKMCPDNQLLTDKLFMEDNIIGVVNALDNMAARRYMDDQCFNFTKPLFESGTQGMKGNTQPVIPFLTETYSNSSDSENEKSFPVCTIKNFPNQIHHTIHYALDMFDFFRRGPENVNKYIDDNNYLESLPGYDKGLAIKDIELFLNNVYPPTWYKLAVWSGKLYLENFRDQIIQILSNFPEDSLNNDGTLFWSKGKRCPTTMELDITNENVLEFIESTTRLLLYSYDMDQNCFSREDLLSVEYDLYIYEIKNIKIAKDDSELKSMNEKEEEKSDVIDISNINTSDFKDLNLNSHVFEKDDDTNYHIKFIQSCSNLRALNYGISPISFEETKSIAGKIIPAVVTTTSLVSGLITVELLKYYLYKNESELDNYRSTFVNLATNLFISSEPIKSPMIKIGSTSINSWKKFVETKNLTLESFIKKYSDMFMNEITMILYGTGIIYAEFMRSEEDMKKSLVDLLKDKMEIDISNGTPINLIIAGDDEDIDFPSIQVKIESLSESLSSMNFSSSVDLM